MDLDYGRALQECESVLQIVIAEIMSFQDEFYDSRGIKSPPNRPSIVGRWLYILCDVPRE